MARNITAADIEAAKRLKAIYDTQKYGPERLTQVKLAELMGFSQQVTVSQYLNCKIPLGLEATLRFAKVLNVAPEDIRPDYKPLLTNAIAVDSIHTVRVIGTFSGAKIKRGSIETEIKELSAMDHYAVLIDTPIYRKARIREGSHLIVATGVALQRDDDVYIQEKSGENTIAVFIGTNDANDVYIVRCLATGELRDIFKEDVKSIDLIAGVQNPSRK